MLQILKNCKKLQI